MKTRRIAALLCSLLPILLTLTNAAVTAADPPQQLEQWLADHKLSAETLPQLQQQPFATSALSAAEATAAGETLWNARREQLRETRRAEFESRVITLDGRKMPFWYEVFGEAPADGRRLFISMHGGGGAPARVNDQQYENQKRLYAPQEGVYLVPRAPTNTWNLWHEAHVDRFFDRLITDMIVFENVNPDRVYIMGYSAGGDGVYQLAPRMADRLAAAAMMAGHPNETQPDGLRNLPFTIHMGAEDAAYRRNKIAAEWKVKLKELQQADPDGYQHEVVLHIGRGHWMKLQDRVAVPWMAGFERRRFPQRIVWQQDDVTHERFYWLQVDRAKAAGRPRIVATKTGNTVTIEQADVGELTILANDDVFDLSQPLTVRHADRELFRGTVPRTIFALAQSLLDRDDPRLVFSAGVTVTLPKPAAK